MHLYVVNVYCPAWCCVVSFTFRSTVAGFRSCYRSYVLLLTLLTFVTGYSCAIVVPLRSLFCIAVVVRVKPFCTQRLLTLRCCNVDCLRYRPCVCPIMRCLLLLYLFGSFVVVVHCSCTLFGTLLFLPRLVDCAPLHCLLVRSLRVRVVVVVTLYSCWVTFWFCRNQRCCCVCFALLALLYLLFVVVCSLTLLIPLWLLRLLLRLFRSRFALLRFVVLFPFGAPFALPVRFRVCVVPGLLLFPPFPFIVLALCCRYSCCVDCWFPDYAFYRVLVVIWFHCIRWITVVRGYVLLLLFCSR